MTEELQKNADEMRECYVYEREKNNELSQKIEKLTSGLKEIRNNLRSIDGPTPWDEYIDDALDITIKLLAELEDKHE